MQFAKDSIGDSTARQRIASTLRRLADELAPPKLTDDAIEPVVDGPTLSVDPEKSVEQDQLLKRMQKMLCLGDLEELGNLLADADPTHPPTEEFLNKLLVKTENHFVGDRDDGPLAAFFVAVWSKGSQFVYLPECKMSKGTLPAYHGKGSRWSTLHFLFSRNPDHWGASEIAYVAQYVAFLADRIPQSFTKLSVGADGRSRTPIHVLAESLRCTPDLLAYLLLEFFPDRERRKDLLDAVGRAVPGYSPLDGLFEWPAGVVCSYLPLLSVGFARYLDDLKPGPHARLRLAKSLQSLSPIMNHLLRNRLLNHKRPTFTDGWENWTQPILDQITANARICAGIHAAISAGDDYLVVSSRRALMIMYAVVLSELYLYSPSFHNCFKAKMDEVIASNSASSLAIRSQLKELAEMRCARLESAYVTSSEETQLKLEAFLSRSKPNMPTQ